MQHYKGLHGVITACTNPESLWGEQMSPYCKKYCCLILPLFVKVGAAPTRKRGMLSWQTHVVHVGISTPLAKRVPGFCMHLLASYYCNFRRLCPQPLKHLEHCKRSGCIHAPHSLCTFCCCQYSMIPACVQVRRPDMVSLGTLPLPGAHITTLTSLANFKPGHADRSQANQCDSELDASSRSAGGDSQESELDTDDELEAAYEDRQATNLREANLAYDVAMSRVAAEDNTASFRPHWPDDPTHASHASFDDWAANGSHADGTPKALASHDSFSFANGCQETPAHPELQYRQPVPSAWPDSVPEVSVQESRRGSIDVQAVQDLFQDFLHKAGLDSHLEVRATSGRASDPHCQRNVTVQNVLPCGTFIKIQLN